MSPMLLASALVMGLLGSTHCVVMCGGVVAMTCSSLPLVSRGTVRAQLPYLLGYNAGRISSYAAAGAVAGAVGAGLGSLASVSHGLLALRFAAGAMMIAVGLYLSGWQGAMRWAERVGEPVWRRLAPVARRMVPIRTPWQALGLGLMWGWMPCGLVYAALASSVTSTSALGGAATMAAFGVGTLPMLLALGSTAALVTRLARAGPVRALAGAVVVALGVAQVAHAGAVWHLAGRGGPPACCAGHHASVAAR